MIFSLVVLALLCHFFEPSQGVRKQCVLYTFASGGTTGPFTQEKWTETNKLFGFETERAVVEEGMKCLAFIKEWYGIDVEVNNDTLSGKVTTPVTFTTAAVNGTFEISALNPSTNFRLYSELRGRRVRRYYAPVAINYWGIKTENEFLVTEGRNKGMVVPANSPIGCRDMAIEVGRRGFEPVILLRHESRVPALITPMPLKQGKFIMFNNHVTSLNNLHFGDGVARGVLPIEGEGKVDGRMVVSFACEDG